MLSLAGAGAKVENVDPMRAARTPDSPRRTPVRAVSLSDLSDLYFDTHTALFWALFRLTLSGSPL